MASAARLLPPGGAGLAPLVGFAAQVAVAARSPAEAGIGSVDRPYFHYMKARVARDYPGLLNMTGKCSRYPNTTLAHSLPEALEKSQLVVESVFEDLQLKRELFNQMGEILKQRCVPNDQMLLCSNTINEISISLISRHRCFIDFVIFDSGFG